MNLLGYDWRGFEFQQPWFLLGLILVPWAAWWLSRPSAVPAIPFPTLRFLRPHGLPPRARPGRWRVLAVLFTLALMSLALARPRLPAGEIPDPSKGIDIMLALDFSSSMTVRDFHLQGKRVSRREALTYTVENFIAKRPRDRVGILGFARAPFLVSPLTLDHGWAINSLHQVEQSQGTAIGEGLVAAVHFLTKASQRSKVIILVTDGDNDLGRSPLEVVSYPKREGVKVHSILIGPEVLHGARLANHELLKVSRATGGQLFQATDTRGLLGVYDMIDQLEKKALMEKRMVAYQELFPWLTGAALALALGEVLLANLYRRRLP